MSLSPALSPVADVASHMPEHRGDQLDRVAAALDSLHGERRRLERLGFETPLQRCHDQLRYWQFVGALLALDPEAGR
ncbi:MAG TPA: hypothetical protein VMJ70_15730 [Candidatus Sulfotelmatobacter sp.]|nr:hypothetical protein [Candidatus Sulfotelmatobacter sp.]